MSDFKCEPDVIRSPEVVVTRLNVVMAIQGLSQHIKDLEDLGAPGCTSSIEDARNQRAKLVDAFVQMYAKPNGANCCDEFKGLALNLLSEAKGLKVYPYGAGVRFQLGSVDAPPVIYYNCDIAIAKSICLSINNVIKGLEQQTEVQGG